jgi:hypothetical protein
MALMAINARMANTLFPDDMMNLEPKSPEASTHASGCADISIDPAIMTPQDLDVLSP